MRGKFFYLKLCLLFTGISLVLVFLYTEKLRSIVEDNTMEAIEEIALHDRGAINTSIEFFLTELGGIEKRLENSGIMTISELEAQLNMESTSTSFNRLFVVAEDGTIYTDRFLIYTPGNNKLGDRFNFQELFKNASQSELVFRYDDKAEFAGISRESILYARKLVDFEIEGINLVALIGFTDKNFLQEHMIIDNFVKDGTAYGFSSVIDGEGNYIVGRTREVYLDNDTNFFQLLDGAASTTMNADEIRARMAANETFHFYMDYEGGERLIFFMPFMPQRGQYNHWYFIMVVSNDYMWEQRATLMIMSLSLLGGVSLFMILLILYGVFTRNRLLMANEAVRVRSEFLSNMSHEIRTPLNGLIGLNYLITTNLETPDRLAQIKQWLAKSKSLADYLLALLNDILDMSKLQAGKIDLIEEPFSVVDVVDDIVFMQSANAEKRGINLHSKVDAPWPLVVGDKTRLKQILTNIVGNAVKYTLKDGEISINLTQKLLNDKQVETTFICRDSGIGMSQAFLEKIFDPFSQDKRSEQASALKGTGLGMPITRELTLAMGGSISVTSEEGRGSEFVVIIPFLLAPEEKAQESAQGVEETAASPASGRVLLAEDAEFNAEFLIELLTDQGFSVEHAVNGKEAVDIFAASQPGEFSVILMDMQMPVMDGCEAAMAIRKLERPDAASVIIYACTANTFKEDMDRAMRSGMNDFLTKPIDIKVFLNKIKNL